MTRASEIDARFDAGEDVSEFFEMDKPIVRYPQDEPVKRVSINFPAWLLDEIDAQARHLAVSRQAVTVTWLAEKAEEKRVSA